MLLKSILFLIFFTNVFQYSACSAPQQTDYRSAANENKPVNSVSENLANVNKPTNIAEESFVREWKNKFEAAAAELESNRRLWQENKMTDYNFVIAKYAGGNTNEWNRSPVLIKVRKDEKISIEVESKSDSSIMAGADGFEDFDTIGKLFDYIKQKLNDKNIIDVEYDKKLGYPKNVFMRFTFNVSDHNYQTIQISKFETSK